MFHPSVLKLFYLFPQLRYLQTLSSIAAEHNSTIIFPMPMNILDHFMDKGNHHKRSVKVAPEKIIEQTDLEAL